MLDHFLHKTLNMCHGTAYSATFAFLQIVLVLSFNMACLDFVIFSSFGFSPPSWERESFPGRSPSIENKPALGLSAEIFVWKEWLLPGKVFLLFTCYPDAAQTLALAQDHSMDIPSQDRLKVKSPHGDFFSCTEWPLLCTCGSWAPKAFS